jgi:hypothetical protein
MSFKHYLNQLSFDNFICPSFIEKSMDIEKFIEFVSLYTENYLYPAFLFFFMKACRIYNNVNDYCIYLYDTNEIIRNTVDDIQYNVSVGYSFIINRKMEPKENHWFSTSWITPNDSSLTKYYNYNEEYSNFFTKYFCNDLFEFGHDCSSEYAVRYLQSVNFYLEKKPLAMYPLLIIKAITPNNVPFFSVRNAISPLTPFVYKKSSTKFISIEYTHPEMSEAIELKLDNGYYICENELFTPTFVLRLLEHQSKSYYFDNRYKIRILDSECSMIDFGCETYLLLNRNGYILMTDENIERENDVNGYTGSSEEDSDETPLIIDPSIDLGSLYTPFEFGYRH